MIVLVCGTRGWTDADAIERRLRQLAGTTLRRITLIHGDARGADRLAAGIATGWGWNVVAYPAEWDRHGKSAGFIRNVQMLEQEPDIVLAFQLGGSRGTQHTITEARRRGIPVEVITPDNAS
jgi:hypothetical protein